METINKGGRPNRLNASVKIEYLTDPETANRLNKLAFQKQRTRNSLVREAVNELLNKYADDLPEVDGNVV